MTSRQRHSGFTLMEVMIVIAIIGLILMIVLPNISKLFSAQAGVQSRNLIDAQLRTARGLAIRDRKYTGVHFQRHYQSGDYWSAVIQETNDSHVGATSQFMDLASLTGDEPIIGTYTGSMALVDGTRPRKMPAGIGVGVVVSNRNALIPSSPIHDLGDHYENLGAFATSSMMSNAPYAAPFTTFTVLFDPDGRLVSTPISGNLNGAVPFLHADSGLWCSPVFYDPVDPDTGNVSQKIWQLPPYDDQYASAICLFDSTIIESLMAGGNLTEAEAYLDENARFLPVNLFIGGFIRPKAE